MNLSVKNGLIPGTRMKRSDMGDVTGLPFLDKIFFVTDGILLGQVREITGVDGSTLQNWVKRGWLDGTVNKKYSKMLLARILIINMLRDTLRLDQIDYLLRYINGNLNDRRDDIIPDPELYDYICAILDRVSDISSDAELDLVACIEDVTAGYEERISGASRRLRSALEIIVTAYYSALIRSYSLRLYDSL